VGEKAMKATMKGHNSKIMEISRKKEDKRGRELDNRGTLTGSTRRTG